MAEEKEKPLTRKDVTKLIKENGGTANGLDLSGKEFEEGIDLHGLELKRILLKGAILSGAHLEEADLKGAHLEGAKLTDAHLEEADLRGARLDEADLTGTHLERANLGSTHLESAKLRSAHLEGAKLGGAHLKEAKLWGAYLQGTNLRGAHLEGAKLRSTHLERAKLKSAHLEGADLRSTHFEGADLTDAHLEEADLRNVHLEGADLTGSHFEGTFLGQTEFATNVKLDEVDWGNYVLGEENDGEFNLVAETYRKLKTRYTNAGMYGIAGEFFFREMTARRKAVEWWPKPWNRALSKLISILCGYGERPSQVVIAAAVVVFGLAIAYRFGGLSLPYSVYFSAVSFTALGYGSWAYRPPSDWVQGLGAFESFIGVFMMALFLVTFIRKMTR